MKKQLLLAAFLMGSFFTAKAQTTILSENFDDFTDWPSTGWTQYNVDGNTINEEISDYFDPAYTFTILNFTSAPDNLFAATASYFDVVDQADRWLVSPSIDLTDAEADVVLSFGAASGDVNFLESYEVLVSTTGNAVGDFTSVLTVTDEAAPADDASFTTRTVNLTSYIGQTIYIAFRQTSTDEFLLFFDDISVVSNTTAGLNDKALTKLSVYPNPANDIVTIAAGDALVNNVSIVDINGRTVKSVKFDGLANTQVNVSDLAKGVYVMTISSDKGTTTQKLMKN
jgi:hypothetical protein